MLSKLHRLPRASASILSTSHPQTVFTSLGTLKYIPASIWAFSVIISKKNEKKATKRSALRRRVYEALRKRYARTESPHIWGMLYLSKQATTFSFEEIQTHVETLIQKTTRRP